MASTTKSLQDLDHSSPTIIGGTARIRGYLVPAIFGVVVWSVVCLGPLQIELAAPNARTPHVLLYLQPLLLLAIGVITQRALFTLVAFPLALGTCFFVLGPLDLRALNTPQGAVTLASALIVYLAGTVRFGLRRGEERPRVVGDRLVSGVAAEFKPILQRLWPRLALLVAAFVVPLLGLYGTEGQLLVIENFPDRRVDALVLIHTVHLFIVVLVAYLFFLSPSVNHALELGELRRKLQTMQDPRALAIRRRNLLVYMAVGLLLVALYALRIRALAG